MEIGSKGLVEINLTIPQGTSLTFDVAHKDDSGQPVSHVGSTFHMEFQSKDGKSQVDLSSCCTGTEVGVTVTIPASATSELKVGKMLWDLIADMTSGEVVRLAYGGVSIIDTYALDGGNGD